MKNYVKVVACCLCCVFALVILGTPKTLETISQVSKDIASVQAKSYSLPTSPASDSAPLRFRGSASGRASLKFINYTKFHAWAAKATKKCKNAGCLIKLPAVQALRESAYFRTQPVSVLKGDLVELRSIAKNKLGIFVTSKGKSKKVASVALSSANWGVQATGLKYFVSNDDVFTSNIPSSISGGTDCSCVKVLIVPSPERWLASFISESKWREMVAAAIQKLVQQGVPTSAMIDLMRLDPADAVTAKASKNDARSLASQLGARLEALYEQGDPSCPITVVSQGLGSLVVRSAIYTNKITVPLNAVLTMDMPQGFQGEQLVQLGKKFSGLMSPAALDVVTNGSLLQNVSSFSAPFETFVTRGSTTWLNESKNTASLALSRTEKDQGYALDTQFTAKVEDATAQILFKRSCGTRIVEPVIVEPTVAAPSGSPTPISNTKATPTRTNTPVATKAQTVTPTPSKTNTPVPGTVKTATPTSTPIHTNTPTKTNTPVATSTPTKIVTPSPTPAGGNPPSGILNLDLVASATSNAVPDISMQGHNILSSKIIGWGANWAWINTSMQRGSFASNQATVTGDLSGSGLNAAITGTVKQQTTGSRISLRYDLAYQATAAVSGLTGVGLEFDLDQNAVAYASKNQDTAPVISTDNTGFSWKLADGDSITVTFDQPLSSIYFEKGNTSTIRAFFIGSAVDTASHPVGFTVTMPPLSNFPPAGVVFAQPDTTWKANVMQFDKSPVDMSFLNHVPAGKFGAVQNGSTDGNYHLANGDPIRFWGTNVAAYALFRPNAEIDAQAKRLAQLGFNLVRIHHHDSMSWVTPTVIQIPASTADEAATSTTMSTTGLDRVDYWIKALKENGIYVWLDLQVGRRLLPGDCKTAFGVVTTCDEMDITNGLHDFRGFAQYDTAVQKLMQDFNSKYLTRVNPYTGSTYAKEPAIMSMLLTNEHDLTTHFGNKALPDKGNPVLNALFNRQTQAFATATGLDLAKTKVTWQPGEGKLFLNNQEHSFYDTMFAHLRSLGVTVPIVGTSMWGAEPLSSIPALVDGKAIDVHSYGGEGFLSANPRFDGNFASWIGAFQVNGLPVSVTEWNVQYPSRDRNAAPLYLATLGSFQKWDAPMLYDYSQTGFGPATSLDPWGSYNDPGLMATMPAAAILFRQGHVAQAKYQYNLQLDRDKMFFQTINGDSRAIATLMDRHGFTVGLDTVKELPWIKQVNGPSGATAVTDPTFSYNADGLTELVSDTNEFSRDWKAGIFKVDTAKSKIVTGNLSAKVSLTDFSVQVTGAGISVAASSLDSQPIKTSSKVLLTAIGQTGGNTLNNVKAIYAQPITGTVTVTGKTGLTAHYLLPDGTNGAAVQSAYANGIYTLTLSAPNYSPWIMMQ